MKIQTLILLTFLTFHSMAQSGKAQTERKTFNRTTSIEQTIDADAESIWKILTNSEAYPQWNSTIVSLEGKIAAGEKIRLISTLDTSRTFKLKVKEVVENQKLVWGDAMGKRTYTLEEKNGKTVFRMKEKIGGPLFPLFAKMIPSFDASFEQFARDLKVEAERN